jgi:hypothetical protein
LESEARIARRILAIANALDGMNREDAAQSAGMDPAIFRSSLGTLFKGRLCGGTSLSQVANLRSIFPAIR